jgi:hypothetical protein
MTIIFFALLFAMPLVALTQAKAQAERTPGMAVPLTPLEQAQAAAAERDGRTCGREIAQFDSGYATCRVHACFGSKVVLCERSTSSVMAVLP